MRNWLGLVSEAGATTEGSYRAEPKLSTTMAIWCVRTAQCFVAASPDGTPGTPAQRTPGAGHPAVDRGPHAFAA